MVTAVAGATVAVATIEGFVVTPWLMGRAGGMSSGGDPRWASRSGAGCGGVSGLFLARADPDGGSRPSAITLRGCKSSAICLRISGMVGRAPRDARHGRDQLGRIDRLRDVHQKAGAQRARPILGARKRGQRDRRDRAAAVRPQRAHAPEQLEAVGVRHADIADEHVRLVRFDEHAALRRRCRP